MSASPPPFVKILIIHLVMYICKYLTGCATIRIGAKTVEGMQVCGSVEWG